MFERACKMGLEGVVSNARDSSHYSGRGKDRVKVSSAVPRSPCS
jgi:ATP-dependent DNA ligase